MASRDHVSGFFLGAGLATLVLMLFKRKPPLGYPPIRVKGGSVTIRGDGGWERDPDATGDDDTNGSVREYAYQKPNDGFRAKVVNHGSVRFDDSGRRLVVHVHEPGGHGFRLLFRPHGVVRLHDRAGRLAVIDPKTLRFSGESFIKRVVLREAGAIKQQVEFTGQDDPVITITQ